jgi:trehalose 6-phosphate synthase
LYRGKTVNIGIDRIDYIKRLPEKMNEFRVFLDKHAELSNKVILIQIAIPSREAPLGLAKYTETYVTTLILSVY